MTFVEKLIRSELLHLKAYSTARNESQDFFDSKKTSRNSFLFLDANENPYSPFFLDSLNLSSSLNSYPEPSHLRLLPLMAEFYKVKPEEILALRGASEGIDLLIRSFCVPSQDKVIFSSPTFDMYRVTTQIQNATALDVPLLEAKGFQLNMKKMEEMVKKEKNIKLIFVCSPNNPTGTLLKRKDILKLCDLFKNQALVVVDEAYIEFANKRSLSEEVSHHSNLVVLRTLSKAFSLAGARVGALIASSQIVSLLKKVAAPYPLTQPSIEWALKALSPSGILWMEEKTKTLVEEREKLAQALKQHPEVLKIYPSKTHFLFFKVKEAQSFMSLCRKKGILIRNFDRFFSQALRLSVGLPEENAFFLEVLGLKIKGKKQEERKIWITRKTKETEIDVGLNLDRPGKIKVQTGLGFFDHMLEQISQHGGFSLSLYCRGDTHVDDHHSIEDSALALGEALKRALGHKLGIHRYGFCLPMDESQARVLIDLSGRSFFQFKGNFSTEKVGEMSTQMIPHFFRSLTQTLKATIHMEVKGENSHHMAEACFKCFGKALAQAVLRQAKNRLGESTNQGANQDTNLRIPSTKGIL